MCFAVVAISAGCGRLGYDAAGFRDSPSEAGSTWPTVIGPDGSAASASPALALAGCLPSARGGHSYAFCPTPQGWQEARAACVAAAGDLVVVDDAAENAFLRALAPAATRYWIGYSDLLTEGTFAWVDGSTRPYVNWHPSEPNDRGDEDCTEVAPDGTWNDRVCRQAVAFWCERR